MKKLTAGQMTNLQAVVDRPGQIMSGTCLGRGLNARTMDSLRKRGLIHSDASTGWRYFPTDAGRAATGHPFDCNCLECWNRRGGMSWERMMST